MELTPEQRARIHVGMSASMTMIAYDNPEAIVVPPGAVQERDGRRVVRVRGERGTGTVPVTLGITTPDGVEVRMGLKAGDVIQLGR